jgi:hypothetical protein
MKRMFPTPCAIVHDQYCFVSRIMLIEASSIDFFYPKINKRERKKQYYPNSPG